MDDVEVDGRTFLCPQPLASVIESIEAVGPTAPGMAE